jgi:dihydroorotase
MNEAQNYLLAGGRVIDPSRNIDEIMDLGVSGDKLCAPPELKDPVKIDLKGLVVAPGFIDMHVHLRQPGDTKAETICTGSDAAAAGGFTTIVAMPNTSPVTDAPASIEYIRRHAENAVVKVLPTAAITKGSEGQEMTGIGSLKRAGIVAITDDGKCVQNHELMRHVVEYSKSFEIPILDHCQDEILASDGVMHEGEWSVLLGFRGITAAAEEMMVARDIILSRQCKWKVHIQHVSSGESVELLRNARKAGVMVSGEVTPHHLALTDEYIKRFDTNYKMNPPLRSEADRQALIEGLRDGTITVIASDHAPHTETAKMVEFDYAPFGIIGLETSVSTCLTELYHKKALSLPELVAKYTTGPAEVLGLDLGTLKPGMSADITIFDPDEEYVIDKNTFKSKSRNTPFDGIKVKGRIKATIVNGKIVHNELPA